VIRINRHYSFATPRPVCAIRPAQPDDCDAIASLALQLGYACTSEQVKKRLSHMQDPTGYAVLVAELAPSQIAGWIAAYRFRSVAMESRVEVSGLVVDQNVRSKGIGKLLLHAVEQWGRSIGCDTLSVRSNVTRDRAHRFYANRGYEHVKTQKEFRKGL
jgi:GNAT superfamily N-acetyltransferase